MQSPAGQLALRDGYACAWLKAKQAGEMQDAAFLAHQAHNRRTLLARHVADDMLTQAERAMVAYYEKQEREEAALYEEYGGLE